jgi:hypothetical protein
MHYLIWGFIGIALGLGILFEGGTTYFGITYPGGSPGILLTLLARIIHEVWQ